MARSNGELLREGQESSNGWWRKEDWWAILIGLAVVLVGTITFLNGGSLRWLAVVPPKWKAWSEVTSDLAANWMRYAALFVFWLAAFATALRAMGFQVRRFALAFVLLYIAAYAIFVIGQWENAGQYNLEPPLVALFVGLVIANSVGVSPLLAPGFRGELYVKTGIVLLGATVPLSLIALAGPVAILQASIVSIVTFGTIYGFAVRFGLDRRFAATLGVGGAVCGVSAAIAIAGAVGAKKEHVAVTITTVILWAIIMIFALPLAARVLELPTGIAGAYSNSSLWSGAFFLLERWCPNNRSRRPFPCGLKICRAI